MKLKAALAAATLALTTATASAQSALPSKPYPPGFLKNLAQEMILSGQKMRAGNVNGGVSNGAGNVNGGVSNGGNMPPGFNVVHATNCVALQADSVNVVGCVFSEEGLFVCILNPSAAASATAAAACANDHLVGINIIDDQGDANEIVSFPRK